nr:fimbrillin family protein [Parabacteroides goldsteinii]
METKHVMTAFAAATLMLSACSNEDSLNTGKEWDGRLYLSSQVATLTRAAAQGSYDLDTKIAENEKVWLYVDKSDASKYYTKELKATSSNGFTNTDGSAIDNLFFPAEESDKITFYAFHGNISYSGGTTTMPTEYPTSTEFTHTVEANQTSTSTGAYAKSDLLYAKKELTKATAKTNPTVKLEFKHLLSKIEVVLVKGNGLSAIDIKKVEICGTKLNAKFYSE